MSIEAYDALDAAANARRRMAAHAESPSWYAPLYGLAIGGMVACIALPQHLIAIGVTACTLLISALYLKWQNLSGLSVNGYRRGRTLPITIALMICVGLLLVAAMVLRFRMGVVWAPLACGAVAAVIAAIASNRFDRAWRAEMAELP